MKQVSMFITPHMLVGAAIGSQSSHSWLIVLFGALSHFLLDALPHWDYLKRHEKIQIRNPVHRLKLALDFGLGTTIVLSLAWSSPQRYFIFLGATAALLPDILEFLYYTYRIKWLTPLSIFHHKIHRWHNLSLKQGLPMTVIIIIFSILILFAS